MTNHGNFSRRAFLALAGAAPLGFASATSKRIPVGLELFSVRNSLEKDLPGTLQKVAKLGYECVEFYAPYYDWTLDYAQLVRKQMDDLGVRCYSTHNEARSFTTAGIAKAIELNQILGSGYIVLSHSGEISDLDGWKGVVDLLNRANHTMRDHGLHAGYHNHYVEWKPVEGRKPIEVIAANTDKDIMLQFDVGTCLEAGGDPVTWIVKNPGRIRSMHCKDWSPDKGYKVLFGEGVAPWRKLFDAAENGGGIEFYLVEQEGSDYPEMETAERCLANFHKLHA